MGNTIKNPYSLTDQWDGNQLGDPFLFRWEGYTYLYCSSHKAQVKCWKSEDLISFTYLGSVCDLPEIHGAYAPEITYVNGKFWMITSPVGSGHYILVADSPEGPFSLATENFGLLIDGSFFIDNDGKSYLLRAGHQGIVLHEMADPSKPDLNGKTIPESYLNHWTEGPMIIFRQGRYYLTFTGNHLISRGYRVNYCVSEKSPKGPYKKLRNQTLLLETGDEFHALGHSSSMLAPDLDSYYIAYHSFDFRPPGKPFRSMNIDRLFFNRSRMYTNATWWDQKAPLMPWFVSRDGSNLPNNGKGWILPKVEGRFTAEIFVRPDGNPVILHLGSPCNLQIHPDCSIHIVNSASERIYSGMYPAAVDLCAPLYIRISWANGTFNAWLNGLLVIDTALSAIEGSIIVDAPTAPYYAAISSTAFGSGDAVADKSIPGCFDAVHTLHNGEIITLTDNGNEVDGICLLKGGRAEVSVNVKSDRLYTLNLRTAAKSPVSFTVNGQMCHAAPCGSPDSDGMRVIRVGAVKLKAGYGTLVFENFSEAFIWDRAMITEYAEVENCTVIKDGQCALPSLQIIGHKKEKSLLRKITGYTCAENHGMAFCGHEGWTDYAIDAVINRTPGTNGEISFFLRETKASWFVGQTADSLFGYRIRLNAKGISLHRHRYDNETICQHYINLDFASPLHIRAEIKENTIHVQIDGKPLFSYTDPDVFPCGRAGIEIRNEGWGIETMTVEKQY